MGAALHLAPERPQDLIMAYSIREDEETLDGIYFNGTVIISA